MHAYHNALKPVQNLAAVMVAYQAESAAVQLKKLVNKFIYSIAKFCNALQCYTNGYYGGNAALESSDMPGTARAHRPMHGHATTTSKYFRLFKLFEVILYGTVRRNCS
jgi:hypothetical protein